MILLTILLSAIVVLFALKIIWNFLTPYVLAIRMLRAGEAQPTGVSLMPIVEILLLVLAVALASTPGSSWLHSPKRLALWGTVLIVGSYLHLVVGGALAGFVVKHVKRRNR